MRTSNGVTGPHYFSHCMSKLEILARSILFFHFMDELNSNPKSVPLSPAPLHHLQRAKILVIIAGYCLKFLVFKILKILDVPY